MKHHLFCALLLGFLPVDPLGATELPGWKLVWNDEFDGEEIDDGKWSRIARGTPEWQNTMTTEDRCYQIGGGTLKLVGLVNPDPSKDSSPFLTGGLSSQGKFDFVHGKVVIRARFQSARGAWPALWMLGRDRPWPYCGEIDLMEHLNFDNKVHQTIHSYFTHHGKNRHAGPAKHATTEIDHKEWGTYGC